MRPAPFSSDRHAFSATGPATSFFISSSAASCRPTPARSIAMTESNELGDPFAVVPMALDHWRKDLVASVRDLAFTRSGRQCCVWRTDTMLWVIWLPLANALVQRRRLVHGVETPESLLKELVSTHLVRAPRAQILQSSTYLEQGVWARLTPVVEIEASLVWPDFSAHLPHSPMARLDVSNVQPGLGPSGRLETTTPALQLAVVEVVHPRLSSPRHAEADWLTPPLVLAIADEALGAEHRHTPSMGDET